MSGGFADRVEDRRAFYLIGAVSAALLAFLFWLLYFRPAGPQAPAWTGTLPALNAVLNLMSAVFLVAAFVAIRSGRRERHMKLMLTAVFFAAVFLTSYVVYHHYQGDTRFTGEGLVRPLYFFVLVTHILSSMAAVPLVLTTLFLAASGRFARHRRLARFTFPVWLYVSVTGVLVFVFLELWG